MNAFRVSGYCCLVLWAMNSAAAQETRIRVVQSGADHLMNDLKDIVAQTPNKNLQKEWKNLKETLDGFLVGIDRSQPLRMDFTISSDAAGKASLSYEPSLPIEKDKNGKQKFTGKDSFLENLNSFGLKAKKTKEDAGLYEVTEPGNKASKPMYLRNQHDYAILGATAKSVPAGAPHPITDELKALLKAGYVVAAEMKNTADGAAGRKAEFDSLRKELEAAIKFKRNEDKSEFELRKLMAAQFFDEMERFLVESEILRIGWTTTPGANAGMGDLELKALPNTSLETSIRELSTKPSYFANVKLHPKEALSGKWMFPFDALRKQHALARHPLLRAATKAGIDKSTVLNDEGKAAAKDALDKLVDIFDASLDIGLEGFIDLHANDDGNHTAVIAGRAEKAQLVDEIIALLPKIRDHWTVKLKAAEHGGVTIHELTVPKKYEEEFGSVFGKEFTVYVGTSDKAVWGAMGKGALDELKAAIDDQAKPLPETADPVFAVGTMKFGPWVKLIDIVEKKRPQPEKPTKQEIAQKKERDRLRALAMEAFSDGAELLTARLTREGDEVKGEMTINAGIFRFIGSAMADFSKQNLR